MRSKPKHTSRCDWREDEDGNWDSGCDEKFSFFTDGPTENGYRFCPSCGSPIRARKYSGDER